MKKIVNIGGKDMTICANALLPRKYRQFFGRDLFRDMNEIVKKSKASGGEDFDGEMLENLTWLMLREGGEDVGTTPEEWLASVDDMLEVYRAQPQVIELWASSQTTTSQPKKK